MTQSNRTPADVMRLAMQSEAWEANKSIRMENFAVQELVVRTKPGVIEMGTSDFEFDHGDLETLKEILKGQGISSRIQESSKMRGHFYLAVNQPMRDQIGAETLKTISDALHKASQGEPKHTPTPAARLTAKTTHYTDTGTAKMPTLAQSSHQPALTKIDKYPVLTKTDKYPVLTKTDKYPVLTKTAKLPILAQTQKMQTLPQPAPHALPAVATVKLGMADILNIKHWDLGGDSQQMMHTKPGLFMDSALQQVCQILHGKNGITAEIIPSHHGGKYVSVKHAGPGNSKAFSTRVLTVLSGSAKMADIVPPPSQHLTSSTLMYRPV